jgi:hypothetical protein
MASDMAREQAADRPNDSASADDSGTPATEPAVERHVAPAQAAAHVTRRVVDGAASMASAVAEAADELVDTIRPAAGHLASSTIEAAAEGARRLPHHPSRRRAVPLPNLFAVHPEARYAPVRELGLVSIPVDEIVGTAVEGPQQRGLDFKPLPAFRSKNWEARWQRILRAVRDMRSLPPIDVLRTREGYWVTDGHNRVAAARQTGQLEVDADVRAVVLPGDAPTRPTGSLAPVLAESAQVEAAARGRLSRGATLGRTVQERDVRRDAEPDDTRASDERGDEQGPEPGADR